jgi:hypothetical protein
MHETNAPGWSVIIDHVLSTLPEGFSDRHRLVKALSDVTPHDHPSLAVIKELRFGLDHHLTALRDLPLQESVTADPAANRGAQ